MKLRLVLVITAAVFAGVIVSSCASIRSADSPHSSKPSGGLTTGTDIGQVIPKFDLATADGKRISTEALAGSPSVLVFWSYYCPSCEEEAPHINKLTDEFSSKGVRVIGINIGESDARVQGGIRDFGIKYTVAKDKGRKVTQEYGVLGTPTVIFTDRKGKVVYKGNKLPDNYRTLLEKEI